MYETNMRSRNCRYLDDLGVHDDILPVFLQRYASRVAKDDLKHVLVLLNIPW